MKNKLDIIVKSFFNEIENIDIEAILEFSKIAYKRGILSYRLVERVQEYEYYIDAYTEIELDLNTYRVSLETSLRSDTNYTQEELIRDLAYINRLFEKFTT